MKKFVVALLWIASLLLVAATARAQRAQLPDGRIPEIVAGPEVGFRIDRYNGLAPVGEIVVKRDGNWIPVEFAARARPMR